jgi:hypothetical protein
MITRLSLLVVATFALLSVAGAQQGNVDPPIQIRVVLHDPAHPVVDFFVPDQGGATVKLDLIPASLSSPQISKPLNGTLLFYDTAKTDPKKPMEHLAATVKIPNNTKKVIVILIPGPPDSKPPFRAVLIDDSAKGFPMGESRVLSLVPVETAIQAGEHRLQILPGQITSVPVVKKCNEFNMAQTNFYYKEGASWVNFTERQLQYLDDFRRIFIIGVTPGANQPFISTIVDTMEPDLPVHPGENQPPRVGATKHNAVVGPK